MTEPKRHTVEVEGRSVHVREAGKGEPVVLLHGWPTSSYLWRDVMGPLARTHRVIAPDLPGFGDSDKDPGDSYSFRYHRRMLDGLFEALGVDRVNLVVHDLGGPVGLYWAVHSRERVLRLGLLNTLVYMQPSLSLAAFFAGLATPGLKGWLTSPGGIAFAMRFGVTDARCLSPEDIAAYQAPFESASSRRVLVKTALALHPDGMREVGRGMRDFTCPVGICYGARDRILSDVHRTMRRVQRDVPHATSVAIPDCGHFLQEERPLEVAEQLATLLARPTR